MYWSDWGKLGRIERAAMDGSRHTAILEKLGRANGLTIDFVEGRLYWTELDTPAIESSDLSGQNRRSIVTTDVMKPYGLTQYQVRINIPT
jgi:low density lipoprotein receptor-related protein 5/6